MRGLYIHIPFCKSICSYCDFPKRILKNAQQEDEYIRRIITELKHYDSYLNDISTIYIGGGTPNSLRLENLELLLNYLDSLKLNITEYTVELNPELITNELISILKRYKVNRFSIGVETFNENHLNTLGRKHTTNTVKQAINLLKENSFNNISIDLIYSLPYQTIDDVKNDLKEFYTLDIPHISYYSLIIEEKTKMYLDIKNNKLPAPNTDLEADMYEYIIKDLTNHNYKHYEISSFAKEGYESTHNKIYWQNDEYVAVGMGASGYLDSIRYENSRTIKEYNDDYIKYTEKIDEITKKKEFILLGLRMIDGISINEYKRRYLTDIFTDFSLDMLFKNKLLIQENDRIKLTHKGLLLGNIVFQEFI